VAASQPRYEQVSAPGRWQNAHLSIGYPESTRVTEYVSITGSKPKDYPSDGKCELCGSLPKNKPGLHWDYQLVQSRNRKGAFPRGWVCDHCEHLVGAIQSIGLRSLITYLVPPVEERNGEQPWSAADRSFITSYLFDNFPYVDPPKAHGYVGVLRRVKEK
jgi:hypothetical protein